MAKWQVGDIGVVTIENIRITMRVAEILRQSITSQDLLVESPQGTEKTITNDQLSECTLSEFNWFYRDRNAFKAQQEKNNATT